MQELFSQKSNIRSDSLPSVSSCRQIGSKPVPPTQWVYQRRGGNSPVLCPPETETFHKPVLTM